MASRGKINICSLPPDLLNQIFVLVCSRNGVEAIRLASVCKAWRDVQWDIAMWNHAIVPTGIGYKKFGDKHIYRLASHGAWGNLKVLRIKGNFWLSPFMRRLRNHGHAVSLYGLHTKRLIQIVSVLLAALI